MSEISFRSSNCIKNITGIDVSKMKDRKDVEVVIMDILMKYNHKGLLEIKGVGRKSLNEMLEFVGLSTILERSPKKVAAIKKLVETTTDVGYINPLFRGMDELKKENQELRDRIKHLESVNTVFKKDAIRNLKATLRSYEGWIKKL